MELFAVEYAIDNQDRLVSFNDNWDRFAVENGSAHLRADKIRMQSLFDFISDDDLVQVWRSIIDGIRKNHSSAEFNYRCDSPTRKRFMKMLVYYEDGCIHFHSNILAIEETGNLKILETACPRDESVILTCSWCKKIKLDQGVWFEPEIAVDKLKVFEKETLPMLSHGICEACLAEILAENNLQGIGSH